MVLMLGVMQQGGGLSGGFVGEVVMIVGCAQAVIGSVVACIVGCVVNSSSVVIHRIGPGEGFDWGVERVGAVVGVGASDKCWLGVEIR